MALNSYLGIDVGSVTTKAAIVDEKGNFKKTTYRRICYYQTIKEDYRRIKPLRLEKNTEEYEKILMLRKESK